MRSLAQVSFSANDVQPTAEEAALTSEDIAIEFPADTANDYYNYSTQFEDLAMAFEEAMMFFSYGISRDVAVTNFPIRIPAVITLSPGVREIGSRPGGSSSFDVSREAVVAGTCRRNRRRFEQHPGANAHDLGFKLV